MMYSLYEFSMQSNAVRTMYVSHHLWLLPTLENYDNEVVTHHSVLVFASDLLQIYFKVVSYRLQSNMPMYYELSMMFIRFSRTKIVKRQFSLCVVYSVSLD